MKAQPISERQLESLCELNMNDQQNFFKLLKYSNELKINNKYLDK